MAVVGVEMDSSAEEAGAPDSWESADLEEGVKRLLISHPSAESSGRKDQSPEFSDEEPTPTLPAAVPPSGALADAVNQVDQFLREAIQNPRERMSILRMEQDVEKFMRDPREKQLEFQHIPTSYLRLAAHRIAQHYNLQSMVVMDSNSTDTSAPKIMLQKTPGCKLPLIRLADIPINLPQDGNSKVGKVAIKQRPQKANQSMINTSHQSSKSNHLKSVEERKEEYNKARARIFSHDTNSVGVNVRPGSGLSISDNLQHGPGPSVLTKVEDLFYEGSECNSSMGFGESSSVAARSTRNRSDREIFGRSKPNNRVAIFRDRELDQKDPDYDRSYDRYMQRFDPGFGFNPGPYPVQPLYSPAINYNTEFPQLGAATHRPQISLEHTPRPVTQHPHPRGSWMASGSATTISYTPNDGMVSPFNASHIGPHTSSTIYLQSSQYGCPPGLPFMHPNESVQPFAQPHQQQSEASFGLARPR